MDLALCISLKPSEGHSSDDESLRELDGVEVRDAVVHALSLLGTVRIWDTITMQPAEIAAQKAPDLIFNLAEGLWGTAREAQAPALFEWLKWPYVGSDPVTLSITLDKWYTKCVLNAVGVATPRSRLAQHPLEEGGHGLRFPVILKPVAEGSGIGVSQLSVVESEGELRSRVRLHLERYRQPVLIEEFMGGREFTVGLIGNPGCWEVLPIVEIKFEGVSRERFPVFGYEAKLITPPSQMSCPASLTDNQRFAIETVARTACDALRIRDWARVDLRLDQEGVPHVLEVNALPGVLPGTEDTSCFTTAALAGGLDYDSMIHRLVRTALARYGAQPQLPSS